MQCSKSLLINWQVHINNTAWFVYILISVLLSVTLIMNQHFIHPGNYFQNIPFQSPLHNNRLLYISLRIIHLFGCNMYSAVQSEGSTTRSTAILICLLWARKEAVTRHKCIKSCSLYCAYVNPWIIEQGHITSTYGGFMVLSCMSPLSARHDVQN